MSPSNLHTAWAQLFVGCLASAGVRHAVLSPGSRSTPLALALAGEARIATTVVIDERAAGFIALGIARATAMPALLVCTSGTAGAHYYPAVIEASESEVPLVVVTADRPWELQRCGASQTIDQTRLFGAFVRHAAHLGEPSPHVEALRAVPRIAGRAVAEARGGVPGPVHVDVAFRKPLEPVVVASGEAWEAEVTALASRGVTASFPGAAHASVEAVGALVAAVAASRATLVIAGPTRAAERARMGAAVAAFARAAAATVLAEPTSASRFAPGGDSGRVHPCHPILASPSFVGALRPDLLVEIGAPPVSAAWSKLAASGSVQRVVIGAPRHADPHGTATLAVDGDAPDLLLRAAEVLLQSSGSRAEERAAAAERGGRLADAADRAIARALDASPLSEAAAARTLTDALPAGAVILVGNSGVVRELDCWGGRGGGIEVHHQRGAAGIDGLVAGAVGARIAIEPSRPVVVLLGDVAAVHDLGSLVVARSVAAPLVIVVVNNDGGRIFEQLPLAAAQIDAAVIERSFVTPHGVALSAVAASLGLAALRIESIPALRAALQTALTTACATVLEVVVPARDAASRARALGQAVDRAIAEAAR